MPDESDPRFTIASRVNWSPSSDIGKRSPDSMPSKFHVPLPFTSTPTPLFALLDRAFPKPVKPACDAMAAADALAPVAVEYTPSYPEADESANALPLVSSR